MIQGGSIRLFHDNAPRPFGLGAFFVPEFSPASAFAHAAAAPGGGGVFDADVAARGLAF